MKENHNLKKEFIAELRDLNPKVDINTDLLLNIFVSGIALEELVLPESAQFEGETVLYKSINISICSDRNLVKES